MPVRLQLYAHIEVTFRSKWDVYPIWSVTEHGSTDELAMWGARTLTTMGLVIYPEKF